MRCPHCNREIIGDAIFCPHCGKKIDAPLEAEGKKEPEVVEGEIVEEKPKQDASSKKEHVVKVLTLVSTIIALVTVILLCLYSFLMGVSGYDGFDAGIKYFFYTIFKNISETTNKNAVPGMVINAVISLIAYAGCITAGIVLTTFAVKSAIKGFKENDEASRKNIIKYAITMYGIYILSSMLIISCNTETGVYVYYRGDHTSGLTLGAFSVIAISVLNYAAGLVKERSIERILPGILGTITLFFTGIIAGTLSDNPYSRGSLGELANAFNNFSNDPARFVGGIMMYFALVFTLAICARIIMTNLLRIANCETNKKDFPTAIALVGGCVVSLIGAIVYLSDTGINYSGIISGVVLSIIVLAVAIVSKVFAQKREEKDR